MDNVRSSQANSMPNHARNGSAESFPLVVLESTRLRCACDASRASLSLEGRQSSVGG